MRATTYLDHGQSKKLFGNSLELQVILVVLFRFILNMWLLMTINQGCSQRFNWGKRQNALIGGEGVYSYIRVLPDKFLLKSTLMTTDFKIRRA